MILVIAIGGAVIALLVVVIICVCCARKRKSRPRHRTDGGITARGQLTTDNTKALLIKAINTTSGQNAANNSSRPTRVNNTPQGRNQPQREVMEVRVQSDSEFVEHERESPDALKPARKHANKTGYLLPTNVRSSRGTSSSMTANGSRNSQENRQRYASPPTTSSQLDDVTDDDDEDECVFIPLDGRRRGREEYRVSYSSDSEVATLLHLPPRTPQEELPHRIDRLTVTSRETSSPHLPPYESVLNSRRSSASGTTRTTSPPPSYTRHYRPHQTSQHSRTQQRSCTCSPDNVSMTPSQSMPMTSVPSNYYYSEGARYNTNSNNRYSSSSSNRGWSENRRTPTPDVRRTPEHRQNSSVLSVNLRPTHEVTVWRHCPTP